MQFFLSLPVARGRIVLSGDSRGAPVQLFFFRQVAMGHAHSLMIARDESDTEKERIKKLPEYNPRII